MTQLQGLVEQVETVPARSFAMADAAISDTVVYVADAAPFLNADDSCTIDIAGLEYTATPTSADDPDTDYLTVSPALTVAVAEGDPIVLVPAAEIKWAWVSLPDDDSTELIPARVPHELVGFQALVDGPRELGAQETVIVETDPEPMVVTVVNQIPQFDGSFIDPTSTIPPTALTDGIAPALSPTPTLEQFAVGGLRWSVAPVANADPVKFRVYADTVDPPTIDAAHLVHDGSATSGSFASTNGTALLPGSPDETIPSYYVACIEYDADGDAPVSATSTAASPRRADNRDISADYGYFGEVEANQVSAGTFLADYALIGRFVAAGGLMEIAGDGTITIKSSTTGEPLITLSPDGSVFRGQVIADDVSVLNGLVLQGTASHVSQNAGVTLDNTVNDPGTGPSLMASSQTSTWPALPSGYTSRGLSWDSVRGAWLELCVRTSDNLPLVRVISASTGLQTDSFVLDFIPNPATGTPTRYYQRTIVRAGGGSYLYTLFLYSGAWWIAKFNATTGAYVAQANSVPADDMHGHYPAIGYGTSGIMVAYYSSSAGCEGVDVFDTSLTYLDTWLDSSGTEPSGHYGYVSEDSFDFGASRVVTQCGATVTVYQRSGTTLSAPAVDRDFTTVASGGLSWSPSSSAFYSTHGTAQLNKYSTYYPGASENAYVTYADTDSGSSKHTKDSPKASLAVVARRYVQAALPPAPSGAATPRVYMGLATSTPADTALLLRSDTLTGRTMLIDPSVAGGRALVRTATVTNKALTSNVATLTTSAAHNLEVGDSITVASVDATFNGTYTITAVTSTTLSYAKTASNVTSTSSSGTITNTDTNTFGAGTPAWIKPQVAGWALYGDGTMDLPAVPYCELVATAATTGMTASTWTKVNLATTVHADAAYFTVASSVITVVQAGDYDISANTGTNSSTSGTKGAAIYKGGLTNGIVRNLVTGGASFFTPVGQRITLAAGDTIQLAAFSTVASDGTYHSGTDISRLFIRKVA